MVSDYNGCIAAEDGRIVTEEKRREVEAKQKEVVVAKEKPTSGKATSQVRKICTLEQVYKCERLILPFQL